MTKEIRKILLFEIQFQFFINFYHFDLSNFLFQSIYLMKRIVNNFEKKKEGWKIISLSNLNLKFIILLPDSNLPVSSSRVPFTYFLPPLTINRFIDPWSESTDRCTIYAKLSRVVIVLFNAARLFWRSYIAKRLHYKIWTTGYFSIVNLAQLSYFW